MICKLRQLKTAPAGNNNQAHSEFKRSVRKIEKSRLNNANLPSTNKATIACSKFARPVVTSQSHLLKKNCEKTKSVCWPKIEKSNSVGSESSKSKLGNKNSSLNSALDFLNSESEPNTTKIEFGTDTLKYESNVDCASSIFDSSLETDVICDFTEPQNLTMTIRRPENVLRLLCETKDQDSSKSINAIIRSQKDSNSPSESSSKVLTSKEFCNYLKSYKLTIKPFGAAESKRKKHSNSKTNFSTVSKWRCAVNRPKTKSNKLKWHHTNFEDKPRTLLTTTPPFVTSLAQAYQDQENRDLALEETLKRTPTHRPNAYVTRNKDPCLQSANTETEETGDLRLLSIPQSEKPHAESEKAEFDMPHDETAEQMQCLLTDKNKIIDLTWEPERPVRKQNGESKVGCHAKSSDIVMIQPIHSSTDSGKDSAKPERQNKEDQMETLEIQGFAGYSVPQQGVLQSSNMTSQFFSEMDLQLSDDILSDDGLFEDPNGFMKEFFTEQNIVVSDFNACSRNPSNYFKSTEIDDPLAIVTSSVTPMTQEMPKHTSSMSLPTAMERTPSYEQPSYTTDDYASSDSGIYSPSSMTSPISDVCTWKNDVELQNFFTYTVAPQPFSPKQCVISDNSQQTQAPSSSPEPQLWNLDQKFPDPLPELRTESPTRTTNAPLFDQVQTTPIPTVQMQHVSSANVPASPVFVNVAPASVPETQPSAPKRVLSPVIVKPKSPKKHSGGKKKLNKGKNAILWEFIRDILLDPVHCPSLIKWEDRNTGLFRFVQSDTVAAMWGKKKGNPKMNYEKLSRAMRYYYNRGILDRVDGRRLVYKFGVNAHGWRKNSDPESPLAQSIVSDAPPSPTPASNPECNMAVSWLNGIEGNAKSNNIQFLSQESNTFQTLETRPTTSHLVSLPSASVLLSKWESAL